jgi:tetratricopeptide (TPR) repeat protein
MNDTILDIQKLISTDQKLTFLVGAGISINPPSNLSSARGIMKDIIRFCCPEDAIEYLLTDQMLNRIRYEYILQHFRNEIDSDMKFMNYFAQAKNPNELHYFLADMIRKDQIVITVNFDFLIEYALGTEDAKARAIITKEDFQSFSDPMELIKKGEHALYKLHGSQKNIFSNIGTIQSVITTLDALTREKEGDIFALPKYEQNLFQSACNGRTLIILGYSGGDGFDIIPTLKQMKGLKKVIWIEHSNNTNCDINDKLNTDSNEEIKTYIIDGCEKLNDTQVNRLLLDLHENLKIDVIKIVGLTSKILLESSPTSNVLKLNTNSEVLDPYSWLKLNYKEIELRIKEYFAARIYSTYGEPKRALYHHQKAYDIDKELNDKKRMAADLNNMGVISMDLGEMQAALEYYQDAFIFNKSENNQNGMSLQLENIGIIYMETGQPNKALEYFQEAYEIGENLEDKSGLADIYSNMGLTYMDLGKMEKALEFFQKAFDIDKYYNNLQGIADEYINLGLIYRRLGDLTKAIEYFQKSFEINQQISNQLGMASSIGNMGIIYQNQGEFKKAIDSYQKTYEIFKKINYLEGMANSLGNIGITYKNLGDIQKALEFYQNAYLIHEKLNNQRAMIMHIENMESIYKLLNEQKKIEELSKKKEEIKKKYNIG